jgi:hypothetical protein
MGAAAGYEADSLLQLSPCVVAGVWIDSLDRAARTRELSGYGNVRPGPY